MRLEFSIGFDSPGFLSGPNYWRKWFFATSEYEGEFGSREYRFNPVESFFIRVFGIYFAWNWIGEQIIVKPWMESRQ